MRIIAGKFKSRLINYPKNNQTRPTKDNVRLAIFNVLNDLVNDAIVLDLFSGSGAYGIEAISRGAKFCYFNDQNYLAYKCIKDNLETLKITNYALYKQDYRLVLNLLKTENIKIDLLFLDPPYFKEFYNEVLDLAKYILTKDSVVILEIDKKVDFILNEEYEIIKEKIYGDQKVLFINLL